MSSSNSSSNSRRRRPQRPDRRAHSRWRRSPAAAGPCAPCAGSAACPASGARSGPRSSRRPMNCLLPRGKVSISISSLAGHGRAAALDAAAIRARRPAARMPRRILQDAAHALGQEGRERQAAAAIGRHLGIAAGRRRAHAPQLRDALEAQQPAGEDEGVARHQPLDEALLDLAQHRPAPQLCTLMQRQLDDGADVHAVTPRDHAARRSMPAPVRQLLQPVPALVGRQRVAAGGDEIERLSSKSSRGRSR